MILELKKKIAILEGKLNIKLIDKVRDEVFGVATDANAHLYK